MRILRFSAFFVSTLFCFAGWSQTPQPAQQPAAAQAPDKSQSQPQPPASTQLPSASAPAAQMLQPIEKQGLKQFKLKLLPPLAEPKQKKLPTGTVDRGFRAAMQNGVPRPQVRVIQKDSDDFSPRNLQGEIDPGIRIDTRDGNMCGTIVSYNFSRSAPGEMPKLESVTTCTPSNKVVPQRTNHKLVKPKTPAVMQAVLPQ